MNTKSAMKNPLWTAALAFGLTALGLLGGCSKSATRNDGDVARDVQTRISADSNVPSKTYTVGVSNGVATLTGTVGSDFERTAAQNDAAQVEGVRNVVNNLTVGSSAARSTEASSAENTNTSTSESKLSSTKVASSKSSTKPNAYKERRVTSAPAESTGDSATSTTSPDSNASSHADNNSSSVPSSSSIGQSEVPTTPVAPSTATVPSGANFSIRTVEDLDTAKTQPDTIFHGTLTSDVYVGDQIAIPAGADVEGRVTQVHDAGHFKGQSLLALQLSKISYNGHSYSITTEEWSKNGKGRGTNTAEKVGGGAALGAIIGAIAGGGKGAAIGAGIGAGAGTTAQAVTRGQQVHLTPETVISFKLQSPVTVTPANSNDSGRQKISSY